MSQPSATGTTATARIDPRYAVVFGACLTQFTVIGLLYSYGLLFKAFETEFGWSRTLLSGCVSLAFLMMGVLAIPAGRLNDRYGPRIVLGVTGTAFGAGFVLIALVAEPWHLFAIFGLFIALGLSTHDVVTLGTIARWFERRRGMMTGVVKVGTAAGQVAVPPLMALLIVTLGWRVAVVVLGIVAAALLLGAAFAMKAAPPRAEHEQRGLEDDIGFAQVRGTRAFWTLCAIQFLFFSALTTVPLHVVVHGMDLGLTAALAAGLLSVQGAASAVGRLAVGALTDRLSGRQAYAICFVPLIASLAAMLVIDTPWPLFAAIAVYGFAHGGFFTVVSPTIAEYFGTRAHGSAFGAVIFFGTIGGALGPVLAGRVFDATGGYGWAFASLTVMAVVGLGLVLSLPSPLSHHPRA
jgi:MFS family permease